MPEHFRVPKILRPIWLVGLLGLSVFILVIFMVECWSIRRRLKRLERRRAQVT